MFKNSMGALLSATHDMLDVSRSDTETLDVEPHELYQPFPPGLAGLRILLAEDNVVDQYLMVRMLEKEGCCVILANTGREVLAILGQESFDLVLMDVHMPGMSGFEATAAIRAREQGSATHLPIIALTAQAIKDDGQRYLAAGMDAYLCKPLKMKALSAMVKQVCGHQPGRQTMPPPPPVDLAALMYRLHGDRAFC